MLNLENSNLPLILALLSIFFQSLPAQLLHWFSREILIKIKQRVKNHALVKTHVRTAVDWNALLLATLCLAFHTSTDGTVNGGPHLSILPQEEHDIAISWGGRKEAIPTMFHFTAQESTAFPVRVMSLFSLNYYKVSVRTQLD